MLNLRILYERKKKKEENFTFAFSQLCVAQINKKIYRVIEWMNSGWERAKDKAISEWKIGNCSLMICWFLKWLFSAMMLFFRYLRSFQLIERSRRLQMPAIYYRYFRFRLLICSHQRNISQRLDFFGWFIARDLHEKGGTMPEDAWTHRKFIIFRLLHHCLRKFPQLAQLPVFSFHSLSISFQSVNHSELGKPADFENRKNAGENRFKQSKDFQQITKFFVRLSIARN